MKRLITMITLAASTLTMTAQTTADDVLGVARKANNYFMGNRWADIEIRAQRGLGYYLEVRS